MMYYSWFPGQPDSGADKSSLFPHYGILTPFEIEWISSPRGAGSLESGSPGSQGEAGPVLLLGVAIRCAKPSLWYSNPSGAP